MTEIRLINICAIYQLAYLTLQAASSISLATSAGYEVINTCEAPAMTRVSSHPHAWTGLNCRQKKARCGSGLNLIPVRK